MSFEYGQYGLGYDFDLPEPQALRFNELAELHGERIRVIWQTITAYDAYGNPIKSETCYTEHGIIKRAVSEVRLPAGHTVKVRVEVLMKLWAPVEKDSCKLEIKGCRYHIIGIVENSAYMMVTAESEVS